MPRQSLALIEDDDNDEFFVTNALRQAGVEAEIAVAHNRGEFLALLNDQPPDLVICDSSVPGLSAIDALQLLKARSPQSEFILSSGVLDPKKVDALLEAGALECFSKDQLDQVGTLAARAMERASQRSRNGGLERENSELRQINHGAERLVQAVQELSMARDMPTIQAIVRKAARELNGADGASFVLREGDQCFYADEDAIGPLWKGQRFPMNICVSGWAMLNKQPAVVEDIAVDARIPYPVYEPTFVRSLVMVPIRREAPIGAIGNYWSTTRLPTAAEINLIQALADSTSIAIENVQLYQDLERRVAQRTAELQEANQSLQEFSYFASHDLRAPVRHVGSFADVLLRDDELSEKGRATLKKIRGSAHRMSSLLDALLSLAQTGRQGIRPAVINMTTLAGSIVMPLRELPDNRALFNVHDMPRAIADETLLRQVWQNLIGNAAKFSANCGEPMIEIGSVTHDNEVRYYVRDNGAGFDMKFADRLFKSFQRLHSGEKFSGDGVGLAIVHRIITRHGGRVWAESKENEGATFWFTLGVIDAGR
jgi:signal transduction histidine kinase/DNA-binding NarL/FixJ family response regulator